MSAACHGGDQGRLVGAKAPDFEAEAVFDQEFVDVSLAQYQYASSFSSSSRRCSARDCDRESSMKMSETFCLL